MCITGSTTARAGRLLSFLFVVPCLYQVPFVLWHFLLPMLFRGLPRHPGACGGLLIVGQNPQKNAVLFQPVLLQVFEQVELDLMW